MSVQVGAHWGKRNGTTPSPDDERAFRALLAEAEAVDGTPPVSDQAVSAAIRGERELLRFDVAGDAAAGEIAAVAVVGDGEIDLVVRPALRRRGIGGDALATAMGLADGDLLAWAHGDNPAAEKILTRSGFTPVRELLRMTLDPALLPPASPEPVVPRTLANGFRVEAYDPLDPAQAPEWVRINAAAFAGHPEQGKMTVDDFASLTREAWFDASDLFLCVDADGGEGRRAGDGAAYAWIKTLKADVAASGTSCELYAIGVHPDAAGNRLGSSLLGLVFERMAQHRPSRVVLYVDGDNTRAVDLYLRSGFTVEQRSVQWRRGATGHTSPRD